MALKDNAYDTNETSQYGKVHGEMRLGVKGINKGQLYLPSQP